MGLLNFIYNMVALICGFFLMIVIYCFLIALGAVVVIAFIVIIIAEFISQKLKGVS